MLNFPNKKVLSTKQNTIKSNHSNRGMSLENMINNSCEYYLYNNIANIHKKPTPIQVVKVDYPSRSSTKIIEAYYKTPSTTDYNGIYKGKYIDFEAKETNIKNYLGFEYIHHHQITHLENIVKHGGIGFLIIYFKHYDEVYLYDFNDFILLYNKRNDINGKKSIAYTEVKENGILIKRNYIPNLEIIKAIDEKYFT